MEDKEKIIIDGVNVDGCVSFDKLNGQNICCYEDTREDKIPFANFCVENKDCYYKQLARKTQENESLKEEIEVLKDNFDTATRDCNELIEELKQECEELKEENQQLRNSLSDSLMFKFTGQENETNRYGEALEEIEKYTKKYFCENCEDFNTPEYSSHCEFCEYQEYFDIINKAKGEGNEDT